MSPVAGIQPEHTQLNIQPVRSACHGLMVVSFGQLTECREAGRSHPDLKLLILIQVWRRVILGVATAGPAFDPIRRDGDFFRFVFGVAIQRLVAIPGNAFVGHVISLVCLVAIPHVLQHRVSEAIVELRVCDQATGIIRQPGRVVQAQWITATAFDEAGGHGGALQLRRVQRFDVSTMVLVKVGQAIVQEHGGFQVIRDQELQGANRRRGRFVLELLRVNAILFGDVLLLPHRGGSVGTVGRFERRRYFVGGDQSH